MMSFFKSFFNKSKNIETSNTSIPKKTISVSENNIVVSAPTNVKKVKSFESELSSLEIT